VRGEEKPPVSPWESLAALELLDAARQSAKTGTAVHL
jgi:predicted dehydrogenase